MQAAIAAGKTRARLRSAQRGITLFGLLFWAVFIGFGAYLVVRVLPTINEWLTIQQAVEKIARSAPSTVAEVRQAFDKQKDLEVLHHRHHRQGSHRHQGKRQGRRRLYLRQDDPHLRPVFILIKYEGKSK